jgi:hypothetical protein
MKPNPIIPPARRVPVKRAKKSCSEQLADAIEAYYQSLLKMGLTSHQASTSTVAFTQGFLKARLP